MRCPSDAQAAVLALVSEHEQDTPIEWHVVTQVTVNGRERDPENSSRAQLYYERIDRESNTSVFLSVGNYNKHRVASLEACARHGWLSLLHERELHLPPTKWDSRDRWMRLRQLDLTEDGVIALGLWRERKLNAAPAPMPTLSTRERNLVDLAHRALQLGYVLCPAPRPEPRKEATRLERAGWFTRCWVANHARGLVPTPMAVVEVAPDRADVADERKGAAAS